MGMPVVYAAILLIVIFGQGFLKKVTLENTLIASLIASTIFFLVTNLGAWWMNPIYPKTWVGVVEAYVAGIPFFLNTISGDLFFTSVLFGSFHLLKERYPALSLQAV